MPDIGTARGLVHLDDCRGIGAPLEQRRHARLDARRVAGRDPKQARERRIEQRRPPEWRERLGRVEAANGAEVARAQGS